MLAKVPKSQTTPKTAQQPRLTELLGDAMRLLRRDFYVRTQGMKLTPALARLLFFINREAGCSQVDLAARLEITPVTLGRMIDRLVKYKYVRREAHISDRRVSRVFVDRAGEPLVIKMAELSAVTTARALRGMSRSEQAALARLLAQICQNLSGKAA